MRTCLTEWRVLRFKTDSSGETHVTGINISPQTLIFRLVLYFAALIGLMSVLVILHSGALRYLPFGGTSPIEASPEIEITESRLSLAKGEVSPDGHARAATAEAIRNVILLMFGTLAGTILIMLPITWTYSATRFDAGPSKNFVRALMVLPICATTVVLLIQDSLALAFGLAAMVAAVRFRVALSEAIDGIYIFAAICVGLAAGIGFLGVAAIMALFFCLTCAALWHFDYGRNPVDDARRAARKAKLDNLAG